MAKRICLEFPEQGVAATAELLEEDAPDVAAALWAALETPMEALATHAMASGEEIMFNIPEPNRRFDASRVPTQNATSYPDPGDILWLYLPPYYMKDYRDGLWDFVIVYGQCVLTSRDTGQLICAKWAQIVEGMPEFAQACATTLTGGQQRLRVSRLGS